MYISYCLETLQVSCPDGWRPMQLAINRSGVRSGNPILLILPGCYYSANDSVRISSWQDSYHDCMNMNSMLFYATNYLDVAWLSSELARLAGPEEFYVPLNMHQYLYNSKDWAWAPPPCQLGELQVYLIIN